MRGLAQRLPVGSVVILTARNEAMGKQAVAQLHGEGYTSVVCETLDIAQAESVERLRAKVEKEHGGVDILINNAGLAFPISDPTPFPSQARQTIDVNYYGTKRMI